MRKAFSRITGSPLSGASDSRAPDPAMCGERIMQRHHHTQDRARDFQRTQMLDHLNETMREFIPRQPMMFLATSDAQGNCDNSFRAGPAGFVQVLGAHRLTWPEYRGNGVMASLGNIVENPHVGLLFVDFFNDGVGLHVNGSATLVDDRSIRRQYSHLPVDPAPGRRATQWVVAEVHEAYIHCSKFIPRLSPARTDGDTDGPRPKKSHFFVGGARP
jgi:predicted pyridoxine 5'-phosphate oxidase superfamily flavin-nucleotide-binding protein